MTKPHEDRKKAKMNRQFLIKMRVPIISMWNPWAIWVIIGWKKIETRTHDLSASACPRASCLRAPHRQTRRRAQAGRFRSLNGKTIAIHSTVKWDETALEKAGNYLTPSEVSETNEFLHLGGAIIGTADVIDYRPLTSSDSPLALIDCGSIKRYGMVLDNVRPMPTIPAKGKQGIWYLEDQK
jgi:hypothetical protein